MLASLRRHTNEGRVAALVCFLMGLLWGGAVPAGAQPGAEKLLRLICWQNEGERPSGLVDLVEAFQEQTPGVRLNMTYDRWPQAYARLKYWKGSLRQYAPDLTVMRDSWLPQFADAVVPLDGVLSAADLQGLEPAMLERCKYGGKLLGVPWQASTRVLYCRTDLLEAARCEAPRTLDELMETARRTTRKGVWGLGLPAQAGGGGVDAYLGFLMALGGQAVRDDRVGIGNTEGVAALQFWLDLQAAGVTQPEMLSWTSAELDEAFAEGKLAMVFSGPGLRKHLRRNKPDLKFETAALPGGAKPAAQVSVDVLVLLSGGTQQAEAARFARYMATAPAQRAMYLLGGVPVHRAQVAEAQQDPLQRAFVEQLGVAQGQPTRHSERLAAVVERALWLALSGRMDATGALRTALLETAETHY